MTLIGIPDPKEQNGRKKLTDDQGAACRHGHRIAPAGAGGRISGAAALDAQGHVLGMMETRNAVVASNAADGAAGVAGARCRDPRVPRRAHHVPRRAGNEARDARGGDADYLRAESKLAAA